MNINKKVGLVATGVLSVAGASAQKAERPNIVFIISDQHQFEALGCYGAQNRTITGESPTPNIDRMAREGVVFTNCYTPSPLSAPSRASLETGCYPSDHTAMRHKYNGRGSGETRFPGILEELPTIGEIFREGGYHTAAFGKMHVHGELKGVNDLGYDNYDLRFYTEFPGAHYADRADGDWNRRYREMDPYKKIPYRQIDEDKYEDVEDNLTPKGNHNNIHFLETLVEKEEQMFDFLVADKCVEYIKNWDGKKPFFLHVGFEKPHEPYTCHRRYMDLFPPQNMVLPESWNEINEYGPYPFLMNWLSQKTPVEEYARNTMAGYYACAYSMDEQVGKVMDAIEAAGIADNTIVVYTTDHGDHMYNHSLLQKHCMYETACHVPLVVVYPKKFKAGQRTDALVSLLDLPATFVDEAGLEIPESFKGKSLVEIINNPDEERILYSEFYEAGGNYKMFPEASTVPMKMVRYKNFKYIYTHGFVEQLYDLDKDSNEMNNLMLKDSAKYAELIEKFRIRCFSSWAIDDFPQMETHLEQKGNTVKITVNDLCPEFDHIYLYAASKEDMSDAQLVGESDSNVVTCKKNCKDKYYQIFARPELTRSFKPSKIYSQVPTATEAQPKHLPSSVLMKVKGSHDMNYRYTIRAVYNK